MLSRCLSVTDSTPVPPTVLLATSTHPPTRSSPIMRSSHTLKALSAGALVLFGGGALTACSDSKASGDKDGKGAIAVKATDSECKVAKTELPAGTHSFEVKN